MEEQQQVWSRKIFDPSEVLKILIFFCSDRPTSLILQSITATGCVLRVTSQVKSPMCDRCCRLRKKTKQKCRWLRRENCREEKTMRESHHLQPAANKRNVLKSLKRIQKLSRGCFLLVFTWKNTLKSDKSTENSSGGSLSSTLKRAYSKLNKIIKCAHTVIKHTDIFQTCPLICRALTGTYTRLLGFVYYWLRRWQLAEGEVDAVLSILRLVCWFEEVFFAPSLYVPVVDSCHVWRKRWVKEQQQQSDLFMSSSFLFFHLESYENPGRIMDSNQPDWTHLFITEFVSNWRETVNVWKQGWGLVTSH